MRLLRLLADCYWRMDAFLDGDSTPQQGQRFSAAHPVRLGLLFGSGLGGFMGVLALFGAMAGAKNALTLTSLFVCLGVAAFVGVFMMGLGYYERWRQRHYGHYPHEVQDGPGNRL
ncbi:hypothetical protein [Nonomuraea cavernae]|uniref:hypothetical protein n=1 Tax=Nonomuraea cavernae TaxID=2045107 RepID=UPI0033FFEE5A